MSRLSRFDGEGRVSLQKLACILEAVEDVVDAACTVDGVLLAHASVVERPWRLSPSSEVQRIAVEVHRDGMLFSVLWPLEEGEVDHLHPGVYDAAVAKLYFLLDPASDEVRLPCRTRHLADIHSPPAFERCLLEVVELGVLCKAPLD